MWRDLGARSHRALGRNRGLIWERSAGAAARADVAFPVAARSGTPHAPVSHVAIRAVTGTRRDGTEFIFSHTLTSSPLLPASEAHPAVEILLDLTSERDVPVLYERIRLELCSLLTKQKRKPFGEEHQETMRETDLGNGKYAEMKEPRCR